MKLDPILPALPSLGRIVHVTLNDDLANAINRDPSIRGNAVHAGEEYPLLIARVWNKETYSDGLTVNGQLFLDGVGCFWMTSVHHGDEPGCWHWPEIEGAVELRAFCTESDAPLKNQSGDFAGEVLTRDDFKVNEDTVGGESLKRLKEAEDDVRNLFGKTPAEAESKRLYDELVRVGNDRQHFRLKSERLEAELQRKRQAENDLIADRDRLIHGDLAKLHQQVKQLTDERDHARTAADQLRAQMRTAESRNEEQSNIIAKQTRLLHLNKTKLNSIAIAIASVD